MSKHGIRWGIAGAGRMAEVFVDDFAHATGSHVVAVGSRRESSAQALAQRCGARSHSSYAELLGDDDVDVIYVATPHPQHHALALAAIEAGKAVLVEKAFTATYQGATEVAQAARQRGVFCMEAMWTRFTPAVSDALDLVAQGVIGEVTAAQVDFGAWRDYNEADRLFARELGGGTILDLGVYAVSIAQFVLGRPDRVDGWARLYPNGADAQVAATLDYDDPLRPRRGQVFSALQSATPGRALIVGTEGSIELTPRFHRGGGLVLRRNGHDPEHKRLTETPGAGYWREIDHVAWCLQEGLTESPLVPLSHTLGVQWTLQQLLDQAGVEVDEDAGVLRV